MEKGHRKFLEALKRLIETLKTLPAGKYNPPDPNLSIASLEALYEEGQALLTARDDAEANWRAAINDKNDFIDTLPSRASRAVGIFESLASTDAEDVKVARTYTRRMQGKRATIVVPDDPNTPFNESEKNISASHQSDAQVIGALNELIEYLETNAEYAAFKDPELEIAALRAATETAQNKLDAAITATAERGSAKLARNSRFYNDADSIRNRAAAVKSYCRGILGSNSPQFKDINEIEFDVSFSARRD